MVVKYLQWRSPLLFAVRFSLELHVPPTPVCRNKAIDPIRDTKTSSPHGSSLSHQRRVAGPEKLCRSSREVVAPKTQWGAPCLTVVLVLDLHAGSQCFQVFFFFFFDCVRVVSVLRPLGLLWRDASWWQHHRPCHFPQLVPATAAACGCNEEGRE